MRIEYDVALGTPKHWPGVGWRGIVLAISDERHRERDGKDDGEDFESVIPGGHRFDLKENRKERLMHLCHKRVTR